MPQVSVAIEQVSGTNARCEAAVGAQASGAPDVADVGKLLGNLTHISAQVELAAGFIIEASKVGQTAYTPLATTFTLGTTCLAYRTAESSYLPATAAFASATSSQASASAASASATHSSAARGARAGHVFGAIWGEGETWQIALVALGVVLGGFVAL